MTIPERNFKMLAKLIDVEFIRDNRFDAARSKVPGYMDLHIDYLHGNELAALIALSHYYKVNGDMVSDPDMEVHVNFVDKTVVALTYQDTFGYRAVALADPPRRARVQRELNSFLATWLRNLVSQGHGIDAATIRTADSHRVVQAHEG
ncbi:MAG: hypothetical protein FVQ81_09600 [Candidatus Glassbacteria bacterium]|nr:hypothetical protein [Candidatus Glassbacteria bacterium]